MPFTDEERLAHAQKYLKEITPIALRDRNWTLYRDALKQMLGIEREIAEKNGEPYAMPLEFPVKWDVGAPLPHLLQSEYHTFLIFYSEDSVASTANPTSNLGIAVVEFERCLSAKLGAPNDEVLEGHPLHGKGLEAYTAQLVQNSPWLAELQQINSVHHFYNPDTWQNYHHYVLWFHDTSFECIAESFTVELHNDSLASVIRQTCERLLEN